MAATSPDEGVAVRVPVVGGVSEIPCRDRVDQGMAKRPSKRMANCALAAVHSRAGILHSLATRFKTRNSSFRVPSRGVLEMAASVSGATTVLVQVARSIVLVDGGWPRLCQPSTLRW